MPKHSVCAYYRIMEPLVAPIELIGIYDADSTLWGEFSYWVGARLGIKHCGLCDITHGAFREKSQWRTCAEQLPVPFSTFHRNDAPIDVRGLLDGRYPCIAARSQSGVSEFVSAAELESCASSPDALFELLLRRLAGYGV
jgi:hypothetical protein